MGFLRETLVAGMHYLESPDFVSFLPKSLVRFIFVLYLYFFEKPRIASKQRLKNFIEDLNIEQSLASAMVFFLKAYT